MVKVPNLPQNSLKIAFCFPHLNIILRYCNSNQRRTDQGTLERFVWWSEGEWSSGLISVFK